ncbi:hypothetical protein OW763_05035 [Clostridium aestuarii]|uniref:Cell division protein FtsL n=1 Tax=Clostridium aestuarii TaxID=338193 RepID=A0ABT4CZA2_9CLOT|nr:hypothetical protein [Clostridium aestuarii]MCY6483712.1 hypothetical protein [Clostridium aestuarii]
MIVANKKNTVNGNNALAPEYVPSRGINDHKYKDLKQSKKDHKKINKQKQIRSKTSVLRNIILAFTVCITLVYRYSLIYNMEKDILDIKKQISKVNAENENLRIGLLMFNNIESIERNAIDNLNMIPKSRANAVYANLEKNNFNEITKVKDKSNESVLAKIKKILF